MTCSVAEKDNRLVFNPNESLENLDLMSLELMEEEEDKAWRYWLSSSEWKHNQKPKYMYQYVAEFFANRRKNSWKQFTWRGFNLLR